MAPPTGATAEERTTQQAASGRPVGVGHVTFAEGALRLLDQGYEPLPVVPRQKRPALTRWSNVGIDEAAIEEWSRQFPGASIGLRTGRLVGVDLDILDPDVAHRAQDLTIARLGDTLVRVGRYPKRLLLYRIDAPIPKLTSGKVEILALGQQFVAFGIHPDTGRPYSWTTGETPLDVPLDQLPPVTRNDLDALLVELQPLLPDRQPLCRRHAGQTGFSSRDPVRDAEGRITDGRDGWLSTLAFHAVHDALDAGQTDEAQISGIVWERFLETADLSRPRQDGRCCYGPEDAGRKVRDKLRLAADGRLPPRQRNAPEPAHALPRLGVDEARARLDELLGQAMDRVEAWWSEPEANCPQIGLKATVGLGKSTAARRHVLALRQRLLERQAPARIAIFTPSHALAEETAAEWRAEGLRVAVLRGYEKRHPGRDAPMCGRIEAVRIAIRAGLDVHGSACDAGPASRCALFDTCPKQQNRREVAEAEVVVAPYDALFTGFASDAGSVGLVLIDEGCWQRAVTEENIALGDLGARSVLGLAGWGSKERSAARMADLDDARRRLLASLLDAPEGPVARFALLKAGLTAELCRTAMRLEEDLLEDPGLHPGLDASALARAAETACRVEAGRKVTVAWRTLAELLEGRTEHGGRLRITGDGAARRLVVNGLRRIHPSLTGKPVLHLDATLRPAIARRILPDLVVHEVEAGSPHMHLRLVTGSFGKATLCQDARAAREENERRGRRLAEVVDYVRWHARRGGETLVITYKACEAAFTGIANVRTGHFNAIAGLDAYRGVDRLIVVGRPLPSDADLVPLCGALFGHEPRGGYEKSTSGIWMRDGRARGVATMAHADEHAEDLRRAICEDEVIQAIGRGRGVNRTEANPLEVHVLANLALPLVHDRIQTWDSVVPDIVQRMLLAGVAVDSPADAVVLHSQLFEAEKQAQKLFERTAFKRQNPIRDTYREMSLKSAAYRRAGRGRSWQRAYWIFGAQDDVADGLRARLGPLEYTPDD